MQQTNKQTNKSKDINKTTATQATIFTCRSTAPFPTCVPTSYNPLLQISNLALHKKLPAGLSRESPLHQLAPIIVKEFIAPLAPTPSQMEEHWSSSRGPM